MTDFVTMIPSYFDMQCTPASVYPVQDIAYVILRHIYNIVLTSYQHMYPYEASSE